MLTLFPLTPTTPEGFSYLPDFISESEETDLIETVSSTPLHTFNFQGYQAKRKVASFGYDWNFEDRKLSKGQEIPAAFEALLNKVSGGLTILREQIAELLLTEYPTGSVINWHRDAPPFDIIIGVSLLSDCIFRFRPYKKSDQGRSSIISLPVARRSLYIMKGPARTAWEHSISPVKSTRYSITIRTLREQTA